MIAATPGATAIVIGSCRRLLCRSKTGAANVHLMVRQATSCAVPVLLVAPFQMHGRRWAARAGELATNVGYPIEQRRSDSGLTVPRKPATMVNAYAGGETA